MEEEKILKLNDFARELKEAKHDKRRTYMLLTSIKRLAEEGIEEIEEKYYGKRG